MIANLLCSCNLHKQQTPAEIALFTIYRVFNLQKRGNLE
jgi:hypothetical protein